MSLHRFPRKELKRGRWLEALEFVEEDLKDFYKLCCRHFPDGDTTKDPQLSLEKQFANPRSNGPRGPKVGQAPGISCSVNSTTSIFCCFIAA